MTDDELKEAFSRYGQVTFCRICRDGQSLESRGFGFVALADGESAQQACEELDGTELRGKAFQVKQLEGDALAPFTQPPLGPCLEFQEKKSCSFGSFCRFSHVLTENDDMERESSERENNSSRNVTAEEAAPRKQPRPTIEEEPAKPSKGRKKGTSKE